MKSCTRFCNLLASLILLGANLSSAAFIGYEESVNPPPAPPLDLLQSMSYSASESSADVPTSRPTTYTAEERGKIITEHNMYRRRVSPTAANMNALLWDTELAAMAQGWSDQCLFEHGNPENSSPFGYVGQNLYIRWSSKSGQSGPDPSVPIKKWADEAISYTYSDRSCSGVCGHYTQVAWAKTTHVGCGQTFCDVATDNNGKIYNNAWIVTCNYGPGGNYKGQYPYIEGEKCTRCESPSTCKGNLCRNCDIMTDSACSCKLQCENCGYTNTTSGNCGCTCQKGFLGNNCEKSCENTHRYCGVSPGWPNKSFCGRHPSIPNYCPLMCELCEKVDPDFACDSEQTPE